MNSYFALHKGYRKGQEFQASMGYGFAPESKGNWFKSSKSRTPATVGSFVYIIQREKTNNDYQLAGKFKIVNFTIGSEGEGKTHRAVLEEYIVPQKPIIINDDLKILISKNGSDSDYNLLEKSLKMQGESFKHPLKSSVCNMLDWILEIENEGIGDVSEKNSCTEVSYKNAEIKVRQGQDRFRRNVEKFWQGKRCALTKIDFEPLLIASHIVRFCDCKNGEHWDGANGMFLTAHIDALFDKHLVTFTESDGKFILKCSNLVDKGVIDSLNVKDNAELDTTSLDSEKLSRFSKYMLEHNKIFNEKNV